MFINGLKFRAVAIDEHRKASHCGLHCRYLDEKDNEHDSFGRMQFVIRHSPFAGVEAMLLVRGLWYDNRGDHRNGVKVVVPAAKGSFRNRHPFTPVTTIQAQPVAFVPTGVGSQLFVVPFDM